MIVGWLHFDSDFLQHFGMASQNEINQPSVKDDNSVLSESLLMTCFCRIPFSRSLFHEKNIFTSCSLPTHITIFHRTEVMVPNEVSICICSTEEDQRFWCHLICCCWYQFLTHSWPHINLSWSLQQQSLNIIRDCLFGTTNSRKCNVGRFSGLPLSKWKCSIAIPVSPHPPCLAA